MSFMFDFNNHSDFNLTSLSCKESEAWLAPLKQKASDQFTRQQLPNRKVEHWKYNDMTFLQNAPFCLTEPPTLEDITNTADNRSNIKFEQSITLTFIDGHLVSEIASLPRINGISITHYNDANADQQKIINQINTPLIDDRNLLINLNSALSLNGVLIEIAPNIQLSTPIYVKHLTRSLNKRAISTQNLVVQLGQHSEVTLVEQFESSIQEKDQLSLQQTVIELAENSQINHYRFNLEHESSRQVSQVKSTLAKNAVLNSFYLGLGSQLNRTDIDTIYTGSNAESHINGIYLPSNKQCIDYHTNIEHQVAHCHSNEVFRGIIADEAKATFNGKIHIFPDAQKSDAYLNNKNLLLTNKAEVNTKPELEIYADDVKCAHGATVAQLDDKAVYYLQTRGISRPQASKMLSIAFINELLNQVKSEPIKDFLAEQLKTYMSHIQ